MRLVYIFFIISFASYSQQNILVMGNHSALCLNDSLNITRHDTLPESLEKFGAIMLFSGSTSHLSENDIDRIIIFLEFGGGLYSGAENWPLQAESNQVTHRLYKKESFGEFENHEAEVNTQIGNLNLNRMNQIPAGTSTVAFPMDPRLKVEAWIEDQPLILSGKIQKGRIIIDGGYSRFYCNQRNKNTDLIFDEILQFLLKN